MKKILSVILLISNISFAQTPTTAKPFTDGANLMVLPNPPNAKWSSRPVPNIRIIEYVNIEVEKTGGNLNPPNVIVSIPDNSSTYVFKLHLDSPNPPNINNVFSQKVFWYVPANKSITLQAEHGGRIGVYISGYEYKQ
jgi:hypothetical protein